MYSIYLYIYPSGAEVCPKFIGVAVGLAKDLVKTVLGFT